MSIISYLFGGDKKKEDCHKVDETKLPELDVEIVKVPGRIEYRGFDNRERYVPPTEMVVLSYKDK